MSADLRVLIADDQEAMRVFMSRVLETLGYPCQEAQNGRECLQRCAEQTFDVIFLDLVMPIIDGETALFQIHREYPDTDVVIMSVQDDEMAIQDLLKAGATAYLCKPFSAEQVGSLMMQLKAKRGSGKA